MSYPPNGADPNNSYLALSEDTERVFSEGWLRPARSVALRYGLAFVSVSAAFVLAQTFLYYHLPLPFTALALSAIAITFRYGGNKPGILAALFAWLVRDYLFEPEITAEARLLYGLVFLVFALVMTLVKRGRNELEARVAERTADLTKTNEEPRVEIARHEETEDTLRRSEDYLAETQRLSHTGTESGGFVEVVGTHVDVTERKRAEEALRVSEYKLRQIIEAVPALLWSTGPDGDLTHVNQRLLDYSGMQFEEFKHRGWEAFVHPDDFPETAKAFYHSIQTGTSYQGVFRLRRADGEFRWHRARCEALRDGQGHTIHWYGVTIDIDEAKKAEEQPRSAAQLQATLNAIPAYTWYAAPSGGLTFVNKRTADYLGLPKDHPLPFGTDIGAQWDAHISLLHPDDREESRRAWSTCLRTGEAAEFSQRVCNAQGDYRWFLSRAEPIRASDGTLLQWVGVNLEIDELKRAEQALRESEYKLRQIIETVPGLIWSADPAGEPTQFNQRLLDYSGMRLEDFQHGGWEAFLYPDDFPETAKAFYQAIQTGTSYDAVHRLRRSDGEYRWHRARAEPLRDREGRIVQWYGLSVDVDEAKKAEDRLRRSEAHLAEAQRLSHTGASAYNAATILYWSEETYRIFGFDPRDGVPSREAVWQRIHPDDRNRVRADVEHAQNGKGGFSSEFRIVLPDGSVKYIESIRQPVFSTNGELVEVVATQIDVTERKRAEEALRESEARFRDYAETASDWLWEADPDHKFTLLTENAFGSNPAGRIGTTAWDHALAGC
jgi:PAS domain S-box-containing protein